MLFDNDGIGLVIPEKRREKGHDDEPADDRCGDGQPAQERHHDGPRGRRLATRYTVNAPKANPPMCAKNATPPPCSGRRIPSPPSKSWSRIQIPRKRIAGTSWRKKKNPRKIAVSTFAFGRSRKYAPSTAAIAPLAPMFGMLASCGPPHCRVTNVCSAVAAIPPTRYQNKKRTWPRASSTL